MWTTYQPLRLQYILILSSVRGGHPSIPIRTRGFAHKSRICSCTLRTAVSHASLKYQKGLPAGEGCQNAPCRRNLYKVEAESRYQAKIDLASFDLAPFPTPVTD